MLTPISVASPTRPLRITFIHSPVTSAAGIVTTIVNMPQELSLKAMTTTFATPARVTMMMKSVARVVVTPEIGPSRSRAILGSDRPSCRTEASRIDEVVHAACQAGPDDDPGEAGKIAPLRRQHRPDQRSRPGDRGEMDAKEHESPRWLVVDIVAEPMGGGADSVVQNGHTGGQKGPVQAIGHQKGRQGRDYQPK